MTVATYEVEKQFLTYVKKIQNYGEALSNVLGLENRGA